METESDSDNDSDAGRSVVNEVALENGSNIIGSSSPTPSKWPNSLSLLQHITTKHDPLKTSQALHNAEALRQASALENVFCSCYDVDTVLSTVQRRERGHFSPVQKLLLKPESIKQVFAYATSVSDMSLSLREDEQQEEKDSNVQNPEKYRQAFVATEMILKFYLKVMKWYGDPKQDQMDNSGNVTDEKMDKVIEQETIPRQPSDKLTGQTVSLTQSPPTNMTTSTDFRSNASTRKMARIQRLRASMRFESSGSSISEFSVSGDEESELLEDPSTRGYLLRLEDLTAKEWKRIFGGLFRFLWPQSKSDGEEKGEDTDDEVEVDSVLVANMCKITKNFVIFPGVLRLICDENEADEKEWLLSRLAVHVYNPDVASLLHGLIHLSNRRGFEYSRIIRCLVQRIVEQVPTRLVRSLSSVSSTSTASSTSSTSSASPRSSIGGASTIPSSSFFSSKTAPLSPSLFTSNTASTVHSRINGCADILSKILKDEFPNTFRYYIQTKLQLASFESVEPFERELFPPRMAPSDPAMHHKLKNAVLAALTENSTVLARWAELGMAQLHFLDAHHMNGACIPRVLVIDILRQAIDFSMHDSEQVEAFVAPIHLVLDTICASINYHQHLSTILEFAARDCFSDSDSDSEETEDGEDFALLAHSSGKDSPNSKRDASPARSTFFMGITPPAISYSPRSGKTIVNHRPLASTLLVMHVVELLDVVILMSNDRIDSRLTRLDISASLMEIFEKFPAASILHCRLVKLYLNLLNRPSTNGRVNNPLLLSIFRSPDSILEFILHKLDTNTSAHIYDAHLAIIGVKIAKICSSPTLQQELIRQFCNNVKGWNDFSSSLVATHSQQMDVLDDSLLGLQVAAGGPARNEDQRKRNTSEDDTNTGFLLARPSSSVSEYLSRELEPFRRLPMEKEGFGSSQNMARGNEAVHPSDIFKSRTQSKFPESIIDILQSDESTSFDVEEDDFFVSGYAYQKRSKWAKVYLKFDKSTCQLTLQDASIAPSRPPSKWTSKTSSPSKASFFQQFLMAHKQAWTSRPKTFVVCNARRWIVFHRGVKKQTSGAFGFQIEVFDGHREENETLTFVTRSDNSRTRWFESMQSAVTRTRTCNSFSDIDEVANTALVESVAKDRDGLYLVVPNVNLLGPMTSASFFLKSEVPEEMPFWGTYHGNQGIIKYASLFNQCLDVVFVEEKSIQAIGYSVIIEFDATFRRAENDGICVDLEPPSVKCTCTDTYLISCNQIIGLTRTIADSEKLLQLLCDDE